MPLQDLDSKELFYAYRKAKADCFHERSFPIARDFVAYESEIPVKLKELLARLAKGEVRQVLLESLGEPLLRAKKLEVKPFEDQAPHGGHSFFSDPTRAFQQLCSSHRLTPEFRLVGDFPVQMHVMSALWINLVGHNFDNILSNSAYGSRLRRYRAAPGTPEGSLGDYHTEAIGSFQPYFGPYKQWREKGLHAIRDELNADRAVIAVTMDLTSYYHRIDPSFIADPKFHTYAGIELEDWELDFTLAFSEALMKWSDNARTKLIEIGCNPNEVIVGGLPIGLSFSRVAANALLVGLDREIEQQLSPVYYGRYVDDLFLVLRDPQTIGNIPELLSFFSARSKCFAQNVDDQKNNADDVFLTLPNGYQGKTTLVLQESKQKVFFLQGQGGLDLLHSIESQIRSVSSERRLMPSPDKLESMAAAKVLTAAGQASEEADTLRRADGLSVRRLGWAVLLRAVETLARDLRQDDWRKEREQFYTFAHNHILRPDKIFDHLDYLPRLLTLAVAMMDWPNATRLITSATKSLEMLRVASREENVKVNGFDAGIANDSQWEEVITGLKNASADAIIRSLRWSQRHGGPRPVSEIALQLCQSVGLDMTADELFELSTNIRESDWARVAYKDHLRRDAQRQRPMADQEESLYGLYKHHKDLCLFLSKPVRENGVSTSRIHQRCSREGAEQRPSLLPYLFPTRPYTAQEVSLFLPEECVFSDSESNKTGPAKNWARHVRALRGVWVWDSLVNAPLEAEPSAPSSTTQESLRIAYIDNAGKPSITRLGISSLLSTHETWKAAAHGTIDLSRERYQRIERLVNQALQAHPRPTHLLLPELSLPDRWVDTVSSLLRESKISLIAGLDYHQVAANHIHSEAVLVLADSRLGFPAFVQIRQPKTLPAPGEELALLRDFGKEWTPFKDHKKPVYLHKGFAFGVLVCSELQNVKYRLAFQGAIDCLMILSWNQDLETFSALVESTTLDVHAYVALVNNREYGDSRVRSPAKANHKRDLCRLRGGLNEHVVVVDLDLKPLREFHSRAKRWPNRSDPFKPVPEGFEPKNYRKTIPS